jgi:uncharacterized RDD family membrane protein YckC
MPEKLEKTYVTSSRKRRIAAFLIDHFAISFIMVGIILLSLGTDFMEENNFDSMKNVMLPIMIIGFIVYFLKDSVNGTSFGKWIMGIMVRDNKNKNETPSIIRLFIRNIFIIIWPVEFLILATNKDKRRLGDQISKTIVVKKTVDKTTLPKVLTLAGLGITFFLFVFIFVGSVMKNSDAYKAAIIQIEKNEEILLETGGIKDYGMMPTGNINISDGNGQAQLDIKIIGNKTDLDVSVYLTKEPNGDWMLIELNK